MWIDLPGVSHRLRLYSVSYYCYAKAYDALFRLTVTLKLLSTHTHITQHMHAHYSMSDVREP